MLVEVPAPPWRASTTMLRQPRVVDEVDHAGAQGHGSHLTHRHPYTFKNAPA